MGGDPLIDLLQLSLPLGCVSVPPEPPPSTLGTTPGNLGATPSTLGTTPSTLGPWWGLEPGRTETAACLGLGLTAENSGASRASGACPGEDGRLATDPP